MFAFILCWQAGLGVSIAMLILGYFVVVLTVLSISAICTNGEVQGGGAYYILVNYLKVLASTYPVLLADTCWIPYFPS